MEIAGAWRFAGDGDGRSVWKMMWGGFKRTVYIKPGAGEEKAKWSLREK
jgi:hypothetical protein